MHVIHPLNQFKHTFRTIGPFATWENISKITPAFPIMRLIKHLVNQQSGAIARGQRHTTPDAEEDISILFDAYRDRRIYEVVKGREIQNEDDYVQDLYVLGTEKIQRAIGVWKAKRKLVRSRKEDEDDLDDLVR